MMVYHLVTPLGKVSTMVYSRQYQLVENGGHGGKMVTIMVTMVERGQRRLPALQRAQIMV